MIRLVELFAGIGAQATALENLGIEHTSTIAEIDPSAVAMYEAIHGPTDNLGDIAQVEHLPDCDLVTWSFPCQDLSIAGNRDGMVEGSGTRSSLGWEVIRLIRDAVERERPPRWLVMENVPMIVRDKGFKDMVAVLSDLGYRSSWSVLNAADYGLPQSRQRCFMVSEYNGNIFDFPPGWELPIRARDLLESDVDPYYHIKIEKIEKMEKHRIRQEDNGRGFGWNPIAEDDILNTVTTNPNRHASGNYLRIAGKLKGNYEKQSRIYSSDLCIPTIDHRGGKGGHLNIADGEIVRVITEREAWRFMGFDDERIDRAFAVEPSRSKRYKAAGNSIAVPVLMEIFRKMFLDISLTVQRSLDDWEVKA